MRQAQNEKGGFDISAIRADDRTVRAANGRRGGFVLISVVLLGAVLESFAAVSLIQQIQETRMQRYNQMKIASYHSSQGVMERALFNLADRIANFNLDSIAPNQEYQITYGDGRTSAFYRIICAPPTNPSTLLSQCPTYLIAEDGFQKVAQDFEVIVRSSHPDNSAFSSLFPVQASSTVHQIASLKQTSIFSYSVFYNSDLEALPGANMTMTGDIHANGNIYLGAESGKTLTLDVNSIHATNDFSRARKDDPNILPAGTVNIKKSGTINFPTMTTTPRLDSTNASWATLATSTWNGTVESAPHGVQYVQPVTIPSIQPGGFYDTHAGLRVVDGQVFNSSGTNITGSLPAGTVSQVQFRNYRENSNQNVIVTQIDIAKLNSSGYFPINGLIYATRTDAVPAAGQSSATSHGIRLVNGSQIGPGGYAGGLAMVTNNPLYVQGDFNTINKRSVGLISDAMNILSNNWNDSNTSFSNRNATDTTINAGFISGTVPTTGSAYSGGLENYPRFLENWSGRNANINGAFINLWNSQVATGQWSYGGNNYTAPARNWAYDSSLKTSPPPYGPVGVEIATKTWWQEASESNYF